MSRLAAAGMNVESLAEMPDSGISSTIVQFYTVSLPSTELATWCEMSKSLQAVVTRRDKVVAHNEMIDRSTLPQTSWADIEQLMSYAKGFIDVVGSELSVLSQEIMSVISREAHADIADAHNVDKPLCV